MARSNFENLKVYQLSEKLADEIWKIVRRWTSFERVTIGTQLVKAADSIGANIAEGAGRGSFVDNRRFVKIARGSLYETQHWLRRAFVRGMLAQEQVGILRPIVEELGPRLNAYLRSIGKRDLKTTPLVEKDLATDNGPLTTDH